MKARRLLQAVRHGESKPRLPGALRIDLRHRSLVERTQRVKHPLRLAQEVIDAAKLNLVNTHATASFFFHPYYPLAELKKIVAGIKAEGYTFVPASELR